MYIHISLSLYPYPSHFIDIPHITPPYISQTSPGHPIEGKSGKAALATLNGGGSQPDRLTSAAGT